jgi:hypothetical protein
VNTDVVVELLRHIDGSEDREGAVLVFMAGVDDISAVYTHARAHSHEHGPTTKTETLHVHVSCTALQGMKRH